MELRHKNWITFTPVAFRGDEQTFFSRDSGLCCRALQALGGRVRAVMPEPAWDDEPDVLRVPYRQLSDRSFWRLSHADAVISYSWGYPEYAPIVGAIKEGGPKLFLNLDTTGVISPFVRPAAYIQSMFWYERQQKSGFLRGSLGALARSAWHGVTLRRDLLRLRHMSCADAVGVVSPIAAERVRRYAHCFGRNDIARKIHYVPHPVDPAMHYKGCAKQAAVIAVGRWDDRFQKRPEVLVEVAARVLSQRPDARFIIAGKDAVRYAGEIAGTAPGAHDRVVGYERLEHDQLCRHMSLCQVALCTSRYESFHIASGEALLCGCCIVAPRSPHLPSFPYFSDDGRSGRIAEDNVAALADTVLAELDAWRNGKRDPAASAHMWQGRIGARAVARQIDALLSLSKSAAPGGAA
jgi:glycosyltransferase involved in cell wall biosynthesis